MKVVGLLCAMVEWVIATLLPDTAPLWAVNSVCRRCLSVALSLVAVCGVLGIGTGVHVLLGGCRTVVQGQNRWKGGGAGQSGARVCCRTAPLVWCGGRCWWAVRLGGLMVSEWAANIKHVCAAGWVVRMVVGVRMVELGSAGHNRTPGGGAGVSTCKAVSAPSAWCHDMHAVQCPTGMSDEAPVLLRVLFQGTGWWALSVALQCPADTTQVLCFVRV